ncbi:PAS domain S-box protein [Dechloromonas sp. XY25]|uniref:histidine kinase n=1 Tax=Dechloromonas hankyongensis TaxID=2908002 RepID=A0ABS9JX24_9RHOO|nr:PAS domain S-box protein [Dechloromonas hankyongensis]MCG2575450.1 PAS domain S-box protein [Dechloromonas hankyongensis]
MRFAFFQLGIRAKLIALFLAIKVIPLILLALLAWQGVSSLGGVVAGLADGWSTEVRNLASAMGTNFTREAENALNERAREELERLTTDTARAVADFLHDRDRDILLAAQLEPGNDSYRGFVANRRRGLFDAGKWGLADDGKAWTPVGGKTEPAESIAPRNPENRQDFHYRPPETVLRKVERPLYHEITFVGLDGREKVKVSTSSLLPADLRDVSKRDNTYCRAETYFAEISRLKPGQVWVSEVIGPYVGSRIIGSTAPDAAKRLGIPFEPEKEAYAGRENPVGKRFQGIVRWATPVVRNGQVVGYVTLALDHAHLMSFTDNLSPTSDRYAAIPNAADGNYAFMWDHLDRAIAHPRHHSIVGFDPARGVRVVPWLTDDLYAGWQQSGLPLQRFLDSIPPFDRQSRDRKPAPALMRAGMLGLDCRYLNFAPQCQGWHDLTEKGGSGSFLINWSGVWKLTTAAAIPYWTGQYAKSPRGFGYITIGANIDYFHQPAVLTGNKMAALVSEFGAHMQQEQNSLHAKMTEAMANIAGSLSVTTLGMIAMVIAIAIWLARVLTRRITYLTDGLQRIEQGDFSYRLDKAADDEMGRLVDSLNRMADSVQASILKLEESQIEALQKSEEQYRQVVNNAVEGILVLQEGCIVFANPPFARMAGRSHEALDGLSVADLAHPADQAQLTAVLSESAWADGVNRRCAFRFAGGDSATIWTELSAVGISWLGQPAMLVFVSDVTERHRLEVNIKEVLAERETILEHAVVGIAFLNPEGRPLWANRAMGDLFGIEPRQTFGSSLEPYYATRDEYLAMGKAALSAIQRRQPYIVEARMRRADGTLFWAQVSGRAINPDDLSQGTVWVVTDISQRRELEEKLLRTTAEWETILQSTLIGITYTSNRVLRFVNQTFADMVGRDRAEMIGHSSQIYYPDEESWRQTGDLAYPVLARGEPYAGERRLKRKNGETFWAQIYGKCVYPSDPARGVIWTFIDISERRKAEQDILKLVVEQRQLNELKNRFVSMTSHEFRTPLATILSSAELLRYYGKRLPDEEKEQVLINIDAAVMRMTRLLDNVLVLGRADAGQLEFKPAPTHIAGFCRKLVEEVAQAAMQGGHGSPSFNYSCANAEDMVLVDEKLLQQLLGNLLSNAFKYSPNDQPVHFDVDSDDEVIRFRIADKGIGIPPEHLPKLFATFQRARNVGSIAGTGLGMAIVKRALDLHGGKITVDSAIGLGTTFTVTIPKQLIDEATA